MANYSDQTVNVDIADDVVNLQVGPEGFTGSTSDLHDRASGNAKSVEYLWQQIGVHLDSINFTAWNDPGALKQAIEAGTYKW